VDFQQAQAEYQRLKAMLEAGQIEPAAFEEAVLSLEVVRPGGVRWRIGSSTGQWYRSYGDAWEPAVPGSLSERLGEIFPPRSFSRLWLSGVFSLGCIGLLVLALVVFVVFNRPIVNALARLPVGAGQPTLEQSPVPFQSATPDLSTITPTITLTPTRTLIPTHTFTPTLTASATHTPQPQLMAVAPQGPWLLITGRDGVWGAAPESGVQSAVYEPQPGAEVMRVSAAPMGGRVAILSGVRRGDNPVTGLRLTVLQLPQGSEIFSMALVAPENEAGPGTQPGDAVYEATYAIAELPSMAWSPDGMQLAFTAATQAPFADMYVYSFMDDSLTRMEEQEAEAWLPEWSPDGRYLIYFSAYTVSSEDKDMEGVFAVEVGSRIVRQLAGGLGGGGGYAGWSQPRTLALFSSDSICHNTNLRQADPQQQEVNNRFAGCFDDAAVQPATGTLLIAVSADTAANCPCMTGMLIPELTGPGVYLIPAGLGLPRRLSDQPADRVLYDEERDVFYAGLGGFSTAYDVNGYAYRLPVVAWDTAPISAPPQAALNGDGVAWVDTTGADAGVWLADGDGARRIFDGEANAITWSQDGSLLVQAGSNLFAAHSPDWQFTPVLNIRSDIQTMQWLWP